MRKLSMRSRFSALLIMSVVVISAFVAPIPTSAAITCYGGTTRDLYVGVSDGEDVRNLQKVLNNDPDTQVWNQNTPGANAGYPGFETTKFGPRTKDAVIKFQQKYGITPAEGYVGPITRAKLEALYGCGGGMTAYDYNGDGVADKLDEFFLRDLILESKTCLTGTVCDVNNDKQINVADVLTLVAYLNANRPTITVTTPTTSVQTDTAYTIHWTTTPRPIKSGVNIRILKDGALVPGQQFGRLPGNLLYDYNNDGVVDTNDIYLLKDVVLGNSSCPSSKVCDVTGGGVGIDDVLTLVNLVLQYTALPDTGSYIWNVPASLATGGGYQVKVIAENDTQTSGTSGMFSITAPPPPPPGTLRIIKQGNGKVESTSPVNDINCGGICEHTYTALGGAQVYLKAIPDPGNQIKELTGCVQLSDGTCWVSVPLNSSRTVTATFDLIPTIKVDAPINGARLEQGRSYPITWSGSGLGPNVNIWYRDSSGFTRTVAINVPTNPTGGTYALWIIPTGIPAGLYSIHIESASNSTIKADSGLFNIKAPTILTIVTPTSVQAGSVYAVRWASSEDGLWEIIIRKGVTVIASWSDLVDVTWLGSTTVVNGASATNYSFDWHVPANLALGNDYKVYVALPEITLAGSSGPFSVVPPLSLSVIPSSVSYGNAAMLSWSAPNATSCTASGDWSGTKAVTGGESTGPLTVDRTFTLFCTGPAGTDTKNVSVSILPTIAVTAPAAGTQLEQGKSATIAWTTQGSTGNEFEVIVLRNGAPVTGQRFTTTSATNPRTFVWNIPLTLTAGGGYTVQVEAISNRAVQGTSGTFSVVPQPKIQVTAPNSGTEAWNIGSITSPKNITWTSTGLVGASVNITLKRQPGNVVAGSLTPTGTLNNQGNSINPQSNTFAWRLAENWLAAGGGYVIEICNATRTACDESDKPFTILDEIPKVVFTADPTLIPASPYTVGESIVSYKASLQNNGIRQLSGLTLAAHIKQGGASASVEFPIACRTQAPGTMTPGPPCLSDSASQLLSVRADVGQFTQGQGNIILEVKQGANVLATKTVIVQLYPSPSVQVLFPNGPASVNHFELGKPLLQPIRWKTQGLINNIVIKIKQADPVPIYDFNDDGAVNGHDVIILRDFVLSGGLSVCNTTTAKNCDIDGDGVLTESDAGWLTSNILLADPLRYVDRVEMFDFNGDQVFNGLDRIALAQAIADSSSLAGCFEQIRAQTGTGKNCDVNRDGTYDINDGTYLNHIVSAPPPVTTLPGAAILTNNKDAENTFLWTPSAPFVLPAGNYKIVVCDLSRPTVCDESDQTFLIYAGPPTITSPTGPPPSNVQIQKFFIQEDMSIVVKAIHALPLTNYKIGLYQNNQLIYENVRDGGQTTITPFLINSTLVLRGDGVVNQQDVALLTNVVGGAPCPTGKICDINSDGQVFGTDVTRLLNLIASIDLNGDNKVDQQDVDTIFKVSLLAATCPAGKTCDINSDGKVDIFDVRQINDSLSAFDFIGTGRRVIDVLREGQLRIVVSGELEGRGFTNSAERIVQLEFNRTPPVFQSPTPAEGQEVNLGKFPIPVVATHGAKPKRYELTLTQNLSIVFQQTINSQPDGKLVFEFTRNTLQQSSLPLSVTNRRVFDVLESGPVAITVRGILREGTHTEPAVLTNEAKRTITVIPVPPNFDLNDDGDIDLEDFKILQLAVLGEYKCPLLPSAVPAVKVEKECDLNRDGNVNIADLASMISHPLYQKPKEVAPSLPAVGAPVKVPTVTSPKAGATWSVSDPIAIQEVAGATGYLVGFIRDRQLIHENYRDENRSLNDIGGVLRTTYHVSSAAASKFSAGPMTIIVRALVNNQWTDAAVIPVTVSGGGAVATPPPSSIPPPSSATPPATDSTKVNVVSPKTGDVWVRANPQSIIFQPFPASTAYYFRFSGTQGGTRSKITFAETSVSSTGPELQKITNILLATTVDLRSYFIPRETLNKLELGYVYLDVGAFVNGSWTSPTTIAFTIR